MEIILFASRLTHQLGWYFSWRLDPAAEATVAFTQTWTHLQGFTHPPWCLLLPTLAKIQREKAKIVVLTLLWRTQPWYPLLLQLLIDISLLIPAQENIVIYPPQQEFIMLAGVPWLVVWPLSGVRKDQEVFQKRLQGFWYPPREVRQHQHTSLWNWDPIRSPIADIMNFLASLFEQGYQYQSVNSYRSAISSVHEKVDGEEVGKHPLVSRMMKGIFNERPPWSKYGSVWKVEVVFSWFKD